MALEGRAREVASPMGVLEWRLRQGSLFWAEGSEWREAAQWTEAGTLWVFNRRDGKKIMAYLKGPDKEFAVATKTVDANVGI